MFCAKRRHKSLLLLVLGIALAVRIGAAFWWQSRLPDARSQAFGDTQSYWALAQHLVRGEPYRYGIDQSSVFRTPGYPLLLAALFLVVGDDPPLIWARLLGAVLGTLAVVGVMVLTRQLFDEPTALVAGLAAALYPGAIGMSVFVLSEAPFCPLMLGQLICWVAAEKTGSARQSLWLCAAAGVLAGLATLVRPSWLLFTPVALLAGVLGGRFRRRHCLQGACMLLALAVTMLPWWVRNYRATGTLVVTTLQVGASLYDGLNPTATGASDMQFVEDFYRQQRQADAAAAAPPPGPVEVRLDRRLHAAAVDWARRHPGRVVQLAAIKFARMWSPWPHAREMQSWTFRLLVLFGYLPLMAAAVWGAARYLRGGWPYVLCVLPAVYFTCLHMVFVSSIRYRQPPMLALIVLAAGAVASLAFVKRWLGEAPPSAAEEGRGSFS